MSRKKQHVVSSILALGFLVAGCVVSKPVPDLGECADTEGLDVYEYGQVGIGTCLAGPTDLALYRDAAGNDHLLVVNSNFEYNFRDGSLLSIPLDAVDLTRETNYLHELGASAISLTSFPAGVDVTADGRYALVTDRTSDKLMGESTDRVYVIDLGALDDGSMTIAERGSELDDEDRSYVPVPADPFTVVAHPETGLVYVLSLHTHQVVVLDESVTPVQVMDITGDGDVSRPVFEDLDGSGSYADFHLDAFAADIAQDETWEIRFREGTYSLYLAEATDDGQELWRYDSTDARTFVQPAAADLDVPGPADWCSAGFGRAAVVIDLSTDTAYRRMWVDGFDADGRVSIGATETVGDWATDWNHTALANPVLEPGEAGFDSEGVSEPAIIVSGEDHLLFYTASSASERSVGLATGDGTEFTRQDAAILEASESGWDSHEVFGPSALRWAMTGEDLLYYSGSDSLSNGIGLAIGIDGEDFVRVSVDEANPGRVLGPGPEGAWDSYSVAYPAVLHDAGVFHMFYAGSDGSSWGIGHATSFDGVSWTRDPSNPVSTPGASSTDEPVTFGALKTATGEYFAVEGSVSGAMIANGGDTVAVSGEMFANAACPLMFTVVDRHVLGRGEDGEAWEDGSGAPAVVREADGRFTLYYVTIEDGQALLGEATSDDGRAFDRAGVVAFSESVAQGDLEGVGGPTAADAAGERMLAFHGWRGTSWGIYATSATAGSSSVFAPLNGGEPVLAPSAEGWDSSTVSSPSLLWFEDDLWMFYEGSNGSERSIGAARYDDASQQFVRVEETDEPGKILEPGGGGDWDDGWVGTPSVRIVDSGEEAGLLEMVYSASDGYTVRIGRATSSDGLTWERHRDDLGTPIPVLGPDDPGFDQDGCFEPMIMDIDGQATLWYEGRQGLEPYVPRVGLAIDRGESVWVKAYARLEREDGFVLATEHGDGDPASAIDLGDGTDLIVDGVPLIGPGVSGMTLTPDGGFLVVTNKIYDNIFIIDVWDDSEGDYIDSNYHGLEAVIQIPTNYDVTGTRGVAFSADGERMVLLLAPLVQLEHSERRYGPEAVLLLDFSKVEDDDEVQLYDDLVVGFASTARGVEEDVGNPTIISGGPTNVVLTADETMAYVAHYNDNSVHVYRLDAGRDPVLIDVIEGMGEEPFDLVLSPDGSHLIVANYVGELQGPTQNVVHSTITVVDVDPSSPTYHQVVTTLRNRDAW